MIQSNIISKILKKNIIHNCNYLINKKYNAIVNKYMDKIDEFKKKYYIYFVNIKKLNNNLSNNFEKTIEEILTSLTNKIEIKFV